MRKDMLTIIKKEFARFFGDKNLFFTTVIMPGLVIYIMYTIMGQGMMKQFMIATFTDLILRVVMAFVFSRTALGATGIWCAWPIGWCIATVLSIMFYRHGPWAAAKAEQEKTSM